MSRPVFDVATQGASVYGFITIGGVGAAIGWALGFRREIYENGPPHLRRFGRVVFGFSCLWIAVAVTGIAWRQHDLTEALAAGRVSVVEGVVDDLVPMSPGCHMPERFTVAGRLFAYKACEDTGGFNQPSIRGAPLRAGEHVRVTYLHNRILRLEILDR